MPLSDARRFIAKMREDRSFRDRARNSGTSEDLTLLLNEEKLTFDRKALVEAMAECIAQLEKQA
ncbi:MAG: Nif11-like leader peptide family natural product precursor [Desulfobacterales bacterium]|nr:Nif11-like leader peptide family natural product precursor [Desulfobacterales bacterium]